ncbi:MAG: HEAT repeat domain-containing protein [Verrucomicrobiae bacterium]|nr:HEAT repeat domain-containing protein [Verrucomicrobiae bacterium]
MINTSHSRLLLEKLLLAMFVFALLPQATASGDDAGDTTLEAVGYDHTRAGVERCLSDLVWTPERLAEFEQALEHLDAEEFATRDEATATLMRMASLPHQRLIQEFDKPGLSLEKRRRICQVLHHNTPTRREFLLYLAATAISTERYEGLAAALLQAANSVPVKQRSVWDAVRTAIDRTVTGNDADVLRRGISMPEATARAIACQGLADIKGAEAIPDLRPLLTDPDPRVRFHAALAFYELKSDECLSAFISLLDTTLPDDYQKHDTHIRFNSVNILKKLTGQRFGYRAGHAPEVRRPFIEQWKDWLKKDAPTAKLHFDGA